jgi:hypothetical protein
MIRSKDFSKTDLVSILEVIESARACGTEAGLKSVLLRSKDLLGADFAVSATCAISRTGPPRLVSVTNGNYPDEFVGIYLAEHFYETDPVVAYLSRFSLTQFWSDIFRNTDNSNSGHILGTAMDFGLRYGVSSGVYIPGREEINIFSFAGPRDGFTAHQKNILEILTLHLDKAIERGASRPKGVKGCGKGPVRLQGLE